MPTISRQSWGRRTSRPLLARTCEVLIVLGLAAPGAHATGPDETVASGSDRAVAASSAAIGSTNPGARSGGLDKRVQLLTAELGLDAGQQVQVRQILMEQRALTLKAWSGDSVSSALRVQSTRNIAEHTAERIRALLDDKQRERYSKPWPIHEQPSAASVNSWLNAVGGK
jgi:hypothetical protein